MEQRAELTPDEMQTILAHRVSILYGMSVDDYLTARKAGTLPEREGDTALEVFSGEAGTRQSKEEGSESGGGQGPLARVHSRNASVRQRNGFPLLRIITTGFRRFRHPRAV